MNRKQIVPRLYTVFCIAGLVSVMTGCDRQSASITAEEKKNWAGSAPPPGFEKDIAKQNREWQERDAKARAKLGQPSAPPAGAKL